MAHADKIADRMAGKQGALIADGDMAWLLPGEISRVARGVIAIAILFLYGIRKHSVSGHSRYVDDYSGAIED